VPQRFVFVFTPPHGSWLNLIENQLAQIDFVRVNDEIIKDLAAQHGLEGWYYGRYFFAWQHQYQQE
jgi:hypothetical protein